MTTNFDWTGPVPGFAASRQNSFPDASAFDAAQAVAARLGQQQAAQMPQFIEPDIVQPPQMDEQSIKMQTIAEVLSALGALSGGQQTVAPIGTARAGQRAAQGDVAKQRQQVAGAKVDFQNRLSAAKFSDDLQTANDIRRQRVAADAAEGIKQKQSEEAAFMDEVAADTARLGDMTPDAINGIIGHYPSLAAQPERARMMAQSAVARGRLEAETHKRQEASAKRQEDAASRQDDAQERLRQSALLQQAQAYVASKVASGESFGNPGDSPVSKFTSVFSLFPELNRDNRSNYGALMAAEQSAMNSVKKGAPAREAAAFVNATKRAQMEQALTLLEGGDQQAIFRAQLDPSMAKVIALGPEQIRSILQMADAARDADYGKRANEMLRQGVDPDEVVRRLRETPVK